MHAGILINDINHLGTIIMTSILSKANLLKLIGYTNRLPFIQIYCYVKFIHSTICWFKYGKDHVINTDIPTIGPLSNFYFF